MTSKIQPLINAGIAKILEVLFLGSPQERFHLRCNQFQHWDSLDISKLMEAFYLLFTYYVNESSSGKAGQGAFAIHPDLKSLFCEFWNSIKCVKEDIVYTKSGEGLVKHFV